MAISFVGILWEMQTVNKEKEYFIFVIEQALSTITLMHVIIFMYVIIFNISSQTLT